jgi:hypothetical protein
MSYDADSSYAYHHLNEMLGHRTFKKGRTLQPDEILVLKKKTALECGHLWMKETAKVMMCWWKRTTNTNHRTLASVVRQKSLSFACHSGLDPESSVLSWIPAGVYPDEDRGRNDAFGINVKKR